MTFIPILTPSIQGGPVQANVDTTNARLGDGVQPAAPNRTTLNTQSFLASNTCILHQGKQPGAAKN